MSDMRLAPCPPASLLSISHYGTHNLLDMTLETSADNQVGFQQGAFTGNHTVRYTQCRFRLHVNARTSDVFTQFCLLSFATVLPHREWHRSRG